MSDEPIKEEIMFDREKVLTPFTADKAKKGDWGWGADGYNTLKDIVGKEVCLRQLDDVIEGSYPFVHIMGDYTFSYRYFYHAPYEVMQKKWVEENNLKVGDKVKLTRGWCKGEAGYDYFYSIFHEKGKTYTVEEIKPKHIKFAGEEYIALPYFAIEKVTEEYRPFANAEEFKPHRDEWFSWTGGFEEEAYRVTAYGDDYVELGGERISYEQFSKQWRFATTGEPAGVKV